jgi:polysaccharide biosynthesis transport protein
VGADPRMSSSSSLLEYIAVLSRRKWAMLPVLVLIPLVALAISLQQRPVYEASAELLLSHANLAASLSGVTDPSAALQPDRDAQTQADLARVPEVAARALAAAHVKGRTPLDFLHSSRVSTRSNADLLDFSVQAYDQKLAERLATAYARQFLIYRAELDTTALRSALSGVQQRLDQLKGAGATRSSLFAELTAKKQQLISIEALQPTTAFLVRPAQSAEQVRPRPARTAGLSLGLAIMLAVGEAFLLEALDTRVRTGEEIEDRLGLSLLGRLPAPPRHASPLTMVDDVNPYSEAIRSLRPAFDHRRLGAHTNLVMVTSALTAEGKSTTIANLAVALAQGGRHVLLCDLDARRPTIAQLFDLDSRPGVLDVLQGSATLDDAAQTFVTRRGSWRQAANGNGGATDTAGRLEVVPLGHPPPDPAELMASQSMADFLQTLRRRAGIVLIDAPALLSVGDGVALSGEADAMLVIARLDVVRRSTLTELRRVLATCDCGKLGFVLTGASLSSSYGYGYDYPRRSPRFESEREPAEESSVG